jgi:hypothetical protein
VNNEKIWIVISNGVLTIAILMFLQARRLTSPNLPS